MNRDLRRREFLQRVGTGVVGGALVPGVLGAQRKGPATRPAVGTIKDLLTRKLGRIGIDLPVLSLGTAPMGHALYRAQPFEQVVNAAIDAGVRYVDTSPIYDVAEERLAPVLAKRRKELFLVTKAWATTRDDALRSLEKSLKLMGVDFADLGHMHNVSKFTRQEAIGKGGLLAGLLEARKRGWIKYIGCSAHFRPDRLVPVIETGEIDLVMAAMNFVDRHTYNFEEKVLPTARRHKCAIVGMKVYAGAHDVWGGYKKRQPGRLAGDQFRQMAIDYALSIPDLSTCVVGLKSLDELRKAIQAIRNHRPLEGERLKAVTELGAKMAKEWGPRFGPVA